MVVGGAVLSYLWQSPTPLSGNNKRQRLQYKYSA